MKLLLTKLVYISQAVTAAAPIEQVIARINFVGIQIDGIPGLHSGFKSRAVQKLPVGVDQASIRG